MVAFSIAYLKAFKYLLDSTSNGTVNTADGNSRGSRQNFFDPNSTRVWPAFVYLRPEMATMSPV